MSDRPIEGLPTVVSGTLPSPFDLAANVERKFNAEGRFTRSGRAGKGGAAVFVINKKYLQQRDTVWGSNFGQVTTQANSPRTHAIDGEVKEVKV